MVGEVLPEGIDVWWRELAGAATGALLYPCSAQANRRKRKGGSEGEWHWERIRVACGVRGVSQRPTRGRAGAEVQSPAWAPVLGIGREQVA